MKKILFLMFLYVLALSCKNEDEPGSGTLFRFSTKSIATDLSDDWIIVRDNDSGDLISYKTFERGDVLEFDGTKPSSGKLAITWFRKLVSTTSITKSYTADTYTDVAVGSEWYINPDTTTDIKAGSVTGKYTLTITDIASPSGMSASDDKGENDTGGGWSNINQADLDNIAIRTGSTKHMISVTMNTDPSKYLMLTDLAAGTRTVSYSTFKEFDKVVTVNFPSTETVVFEQYGFEANRKLGTTKTYMFANNYYEGSAVDHINFPFLNSFPNYAITLQIGSNYKYKLQGPPPTSVEYVGTNNFVIGGERDIENFTLSANKNFAYRVAKFGYSGTSSSVLFNFYAETAAAKQFQPLPPEILAQYPDIDTEKALFESVSVFVKDRAYHDYLADKFKQRTDYTASDTYETIEVIVK